MTCPVCSHISNTVFPFFKKYIYQYHTCSYCRSIFTLENLDNANKVGGTNEINRNENNKERIERIKNLVDADKAFILDYGCGNGRLVNDMSDAGLFAVGYDKYNEKYEHIAPHIDGLSMDVITLIEVIEHLSSPFFELDQIFNALRSNGILYIETSFTDIPYIQKIPFQEFEYIDPLIGHSTIFSHVGLDILMTNKGFITLPPINDNVRLYTKK